MEQVSVLTLNMQNSQIWDPRSPDTAPVDLDRSIAFLRDHQADIILLQEVEFPEPGVLIPASWPKLDRIRAALPDYTCSCAYPSATRPHLPFGIGLAILSRAPQFDDFHVVLPAPDISFDFQGRTWLPAERSVIGTHLRLGPTTIMVLNTHLQAFFMIGASSDEHRAQRHVLETLVRGRKHPLILGGDLNCAPGEGTLAGLESQGLRAVQKDKVTWKRRPYVLDHLLHTSEFSLGDWSLIDCPASDHDALRATFTLQGAP